MYFSKDDGVIEAEFASFTAIEDQNYVQGPIKSSGRVSKPKNKSFSSVSSHVDCEICLQILLQDHRDFTVPKSGI